MFRIKNIIFLILVLVQLSYSKKDSYFKNYFFYSIQDGKYHFESITNNKISYLVSSNNIRLPKGMTEDILELNEKKSIVNAVINSYSDQNKLIAIVNELFEPLPYNGSTKYQYSESDSHFKKLHYYLITKDNSSDEESKTLLFTEMKNGSPYRVNISSLISPYSNIEGFDKEWYSSSVGLLNSIQVMKLPLDYKKDTIYSNQRILLTYSKVQFCYSQFPEPNGCDPYFTIKRNRMDNSTKCSPPTGCVIAVNCTPVAKPICEPGYSLIYFNEPRYYCPVYFCDIPTYYYYGSVGNSNNNKINNNNHLNNNNNNKNSENKVINNNQSNNNNNKKKKNSIKLISLKNK